MLGFRGVELRGYIGNPGWRRGSDVEGVAVMARGFERGTWRASKAAGLRVSGALATRNARTAVVADSGGRQWQAWAEMRVGAGGARGALRCG